MFLTFGGFFPWIVIYFTVFRGMGWAWAQWVFILLWWLTMNLSLFEGVGEWFHPENFLGEGSWLRSYELHVQTRGCSHQSQETGRCHWGQQWDCCRSGYPEAGYSAWGQDVVPAMFMIVISLGKPCNSVTSRNMARWMTISTLQSPLQVDWHTDSVISVWMFPYTRSVFTLESRSELVFGIVPTLVTLILCRWVVVKLLCGRDPTLITPNHFRYYVQIFQFDDVISDSFRVFFFLLFWRFRRLWKLGRWYWLC